MKRVRQTPHQLGYRFYRGYIWRSIAAIPGLADLWNPDGRFICKLGIRDVPRYVDKSIKFGWEKPAPVIRVWAPRFKQFEMFKEVA